MKLILSLLVMLFLTKYLLAFGPFGVFFWMMSVVAFWIIKDKE